MAAITAYAHIGHPHPNDGGLRADYLVTLSEGDRPAWILGSAGHQADLQHRERFPQPVIWIPTVERILDDMIVMLAARVFSDQGILQLGDQDGIDLLAPRVECYAIPATIRNEMYRLVKSLDGGWKIGLTIFSGSSLENQLQNLNDYVFQVEVCQSRFLRWQNRWAGGKISVSGSL